MPKSLAIIAGASIIALAGAANAGGPITLADSQMDKVTAGTSGFDFQKNLSSYSDNNVNFTGNSQVRDLFEKKALIDVNARVKGTSASLGFDNEAIGKNSNVQGTFSQIAVGGQGSSQSGLFTAVASGGKR